MKRFISNLKIKKSNSIVKLFLTTSLVILIFTILLTPMLILSFSMNNNIKAYNRDGNSGTYEVFTEKALSKEKEEKFGSDAIMVSSNDKMLSSVIANTNTIGYVSAGTIISEFDENGLPVLYDKYDDLAILSFDEETPNSEYETISKNEKGELNPDYPVKRDFSIFWRGNPELLEYIWDGGYEQDDYDQIKVISENEEEMAAFGFYNFVIYSMTSWEFIKSSPEFNPSLPIEEDKLMSDDDVINYYTNLGINNLTTFLVGSTSVQHSIQNLIYEFSEIIEEDGIYFLVRTNLTGSGDAFKENDELTTDSYIGFQSRAPKPEELENWNNGIYNDDALLFEKAYNPFAIDPIAIITNFDQDKYLTRITKSSLRKAYLGNGSRPEEIYEEKI